MLNLADLNRKECRNDFRVVAYRHGHLVINSSFGEDVRAAKDEYDRLRDGDDFSKVVLFNFNEPIMVH